MRNGWIKSENPPKNFVFFSTCAHFFQRSPDVWEPVWDRQPLLLLPVLNASAGSVDNRWDIARLVCNSSHFFTAVSYLWPDLQTGNHVCPSFSVFEYTSCKRVTWHESLCQSHCMCLQCARHKNEVPVSCMLLLRGPCSCSCPDDPVSISPCVHAHTAWCKTLDWTKS